MNKGSIDPLFTDENLSNVAVLDAELLAYVEGKFFNLRKKIHFTDYNRKVYRFVKRLLKLGRFDDVIVCAIKDKKVYEQVVFSFLDANFKYMTFETENSYKMWLQMKYPKYHFATRERGYYHKTSEWLSEEAIATQ